MESVTAVAAKPVASFDWYAATLRADLPDILDILGEQSGREAVHVGAGMYGYKHRHEIRSQAHGVEAVVLSGGSNRWPHAYASGGDAVGFSSVVRDVWAGAHSVTRADSRFDFTGEGCWDSLFDACRTLALERKLKIDTQGDWIRENLPDSERHGRTLYVGGTKSAVRLRLYEKGLQMREVHGTPRDRVDVNWCRMELQVRPKDQSARWKAASMSPEDVWGFAEWSKELLALVADLEVDRTPVDAWRPTTDEASLRWMAHQYGAALSRLRDRMGGWEAVGSVLGQLVEAGDRDAVGVWMPPAVLPAPGDRGAPVEGPVRAPANRYVLDGDGWVDWQSDAGAFPRNWGGPR